MNKHIKVSLFDNKTKREDVITFNGDYILDDILTFCRIKEELNGTFEAELTVLVEPNKPDELYSMLAEDGILKIRDENNDEIFRISSVRKNKRSVSVVARQITITDTLNLWLEDVRPDTQNGLGALNHMYSNAQGTKEIFLNSNITRTSTAYYENMSMYQAISDSQNSFLERWGGEIIRNKYNLTINDKRGDNNGAQIRSKKNLLGFEAKTNLDEVCTVIYPKGYDRLKGKAVYSPLVNKYSSPLPREIKFEYIKVRTENDPDGYETEKEALEALQKEAEKQFSVKHIDVLKATYNINFVDLSKTEEYKDYSFLESVNLGDTVNVLVDFPKVNIDVRVISREYDVISRKRTNTTLSNSDIKSQSITLGDIVAELNKQTEGDKDLASYITSLMNEGIKDSYVVLKPNELLIMDSKDINTAVNVARYNKNGLGFSQSGYYGEYTYGFTIDGKINASLIATGILSTVLIQNIDGSLQIDLSSKKGITFKNNGEKSIEIGKNMINFYDWQGTEREEPSGILFSSRKSSEADKPGIVLANEKDSYMALSYRSKETGSYFPYIEFDKDKVLTRDTEREMYNLDETDSKSPIMVRERSDFLKRAIFKNTIGIGNINEHEIYESKSGNLTLGYSGENTKAVIVDLNTKYGVFDVKDGGFNFFRNGSSYMWRNVQGDRVMIDDNVQINGDLYVGGSVRGTIRDLNGNVIYPNGGGNVSEGIPSADLYRFVKGYEGFGTNPYKVTGESFYTAGYGITEKYEPQYFNRLKPFPCSEKTASMVYGDMLINEFAKPLLNRMRRDGVNIGSVPQNHFDAFCSLAMNGGLGAVWNSPMYSTWKNNMYDPSIPQRWLTWYINPGTAVESGLRARRRAEVAIWNNSDYEFRRIVIIKGNGSYDGYITDNNGNGYIPPIFGQLSGNYSIERENISNKLRMYEGFNYLIGSNNENEIDIPNIIKKVFKEFNIELPSTSTKLYEYGEVVYRGEFIVGDMVFSNFINGKPYSVEIITNDNPDSLMSLQVDLINDIIVESIFTWSSGKVAKRVL